MHISDVMSHHVTVASPKQTIQEAARMMAKLDAGVMPVGENDRLVGMITDRDIAVRAIAAGMSLDTPIEEIMTHEVKYCFEDDNLDEVTANMADIKLRRLPVLNKDKRLVGIVSLGDIAGGGDQQNAGAALRGIAAPGGQHSQKADGGARPV